MYETVRNNIINNFLNRNYRWTCVTNKKTILNDMIDRSPFPFTYDYDKDILMITLGDNINIAVHFIWEYKNDPKIYHLINFD
jgi:hypothetical protein